MSYNRSLQGYLNHRCEAIERIYRYVENIDKETFLASELIQDAVIRNFEIIGEASHNIEEYFPDFPGKHPEIPFSLAYQMRNSLAHGYFSVDLGIVWETIAKDLPRLQKQLNDIFLD